MFKHPAKKIKATAYILAALCVLAGAAGAYLLWTGTHQALAAGAAAVGGLVLAWVLGLALYGFGELIEKTKDNNYLLSRIASHTKELQSMSRGG